jgi:hypothetical protein
MGEWRYSSTILNHGTGWRWVVSFGPRPLYPRRKSPRYPSDKRLGGPQNRSGRCGGEKILHLPESSPGHPARRYTDWAIPAPHLLYKWNNFVSFKFIILYYYAISGYNSNELCSVSALKSQSHFMTDDQSINPSWYRAPSGSHVRILITVWHLLFCRCRAPPLTRGRVWHLY